jgi:hypothetical protein
MSIGSGVFLERTRRYPLCKHQLSQAKYIEILRVTGRSRMAVMQEVEEQTQSFIQRAKRCELDVLIRPELGRVVYEAGTY